MSIIRIMAKTWKVVKEKRKEKTFLQHAAPVADCTNQQKDAKTAWIHMNDEQHHHLNNNMFSVQIMEMEFVCLCERNRSKQNECLITKKEIKSSMT